VLRRQEVRAVLFSACAVWCGVACTAAQSNDLRAGLDVTIDPVPDAGPEAPSSAPPAGPTRSAAKAAVAAVAWRKDADAAARDADRSGKPLLVYLRAEWCVSCLELERAWKGDAAFERASRSFVPLWLDATDDSVLSEVTARFGALPVPSVALIDRKTGRRSVLDSRASLDRAADSVLAFVTEDSQ
jgi:thiol:disulfide interchange protein